MATTTWQRRRHPDDVPSPVAVAVADFCRRAKSPAPPAVVREALALLEDGDDARVRALADSEPTAALGPFAVVDVLAGTAVKVAAERQSSGYYEMVRTAAADHAARAPALPPRPPPTRKAERAGRGKKERAPRQTVSEKIAPRRRRPGEEPSREAPARPPPASSFLPKRNLPLPRGRYTRVAPTRAPFEALLRPAALAELEAILGHVTTRVALMQALQHSYVGRSGRELGLADIEAALKRHRLRERVERSERGALLAAWLDAKAAKGRAAKSLGMKPESFDHIAAQIGLEPELKEIRDRFARETLAPRSLALRLSTLKRSRYLEDLGILKRFEGLLARELEALLDESEDATEDDEQLVSLIARREGVDRDALAAAVIHLGLRELEPPAGEEEDGEDEQPEQE